MDMPKPGPGHKRLETLAGDWTGQETMHLPQSDPKASVADARIVNRVACDGFWVVGDYEQRMGGAVSYSGHSVFGLDPTSGEVLLHWFDSTGTGIDVFRGTFEGARLSLTRKNAMGFFRLLWDFTEKGKLRSRFSQDGVSWAARFEGAYEKA